PMDSRVSSPKGSSPRALEVLYLSSLFSRGAHHAATLFCAALGCNGTLQFSSPTSRDAAIESASDAGTTEDVMADRAGFAPPCYKDTDCPVNKLHCDLVTNQCVECVGESDCVVAPYL